MTTPSRITRRSVLGGAAALSGATVLGGAAPGPAGPAAATADPATTGPATTDPAATRALRALEDRHGRRVGLHARNLRTGRELAHRADERFAMCSTFKTFAVGALLDGRLETPDPHVLGRRVSFPPSLVRGDLWAPATRRWLAAGHAPTFAEVCEAAICESDNGAANLVVQQLGGPAVVTGLFRDLGDPTSRLDRWEPEMSGYAPGQVLDTASPRSLGTSFARLVLGRTLARRERARLLGWLRDNRTDPPFRTALPAGWTIADKTGSGEWATRNDVGIAWSPAGVPVLVSCLTRADDPAAERLDAPLAEAFALALEVLA